MMIKKNDMVKVIAGAHKGKTGKILQVLPTEGKIVVDGVNLRVKHVRAAKGTDKGQKVEFFAPISASNVMYLAADGSMTRLGAKMTSDGKKVRVAKKTGDTITN